VERERDTDLTNGHDKRRNRMTTSTESSVELAINTIRTLSMDAVQKANSGIPARRWRSLHWLSRCTRAS
jgi:hypothetical protein